MTQEQVSQLANLAVSVSKLALEIPVLIENLPPGPIRDHLIAANENLCQTECELYSAMQASEDVRKFTAALAVYAEVG